MSKVNNVFICGMFRSGTTLLGRVLNANKNIAIASDGIFPFFKFLRNDILKNNNIYVNSEFNDPLSDYYFDSKKIDGYKAIQNSSLDIEISEKDLGLLKDKIKYWCADSDQYSPLLLPYVDGVQGKTYKEVFDSLLNIMQVAYGNSGTRIVGAKEVWVGEFVPAIHSSLPDMKFIYVVRDPRSVLASKSNMHDGKYPWLFMARQWRKQAILAHMYSKNYKLKSNLLVVKYEDLIINPKETTNTMCDFLDVDWDYSMLKTDKYVNGKGNIWSQNSAYKSDVNNGFNRETIEKWKTVLSVDEVKLMEYLCFPEMKIFNYSPEYTNHRNEVKNMTFNLPLYLDDEIAVWLKKYIENTKEYHAFEMMKEEGRYMLFEDNNAAKDSNMFDMCFLGYENFEDLRGGL